MKTESKLTNLLKNSGISKQDLLDRVINYCEESKINLLEMPKHLQEKLIIGLSAIFIHNA